MALSNVLVLLFVIGVVAAMFSRRFDRWILVVSAITSFVLLSLQSVLHWMYVAQVLPIAAVLSVVWIVEVRPRWLAMSLSLVCLVVGSVNLIVGALDARPWIRPVAAYLGVCPEKGYSIYCPPPLSATERRLRKGDSPEREILAAVLEDPNCRGSRTCRLWYINIGRPPRFGYYRVKYWPSSELATVTTGSPAWGRPFNFSTFLDSDYLAYPITPLYPGSRRLYDTAAIRFLQSPPPEFAQAHKVVGEFEGLRRKVKIQLLKRVKPLTTAEARTSISAFDLPDKYKTQANELLVSLYRKAGRLDKAVELCRIEAKSQLSQVALASCLGARVGLARTLKSEGKRMEAIAELRAAIRLAPESSLPVRALADLYRDRGENDEAVKLYQEALRIDSRDLAARVHLALVYRDLGRFERAIEELKTASDLAPENPRPVRLLADVYREMGDEKLALEHGKKAVQVEPGDLHARFLLGRIYESYGKREEAMRAYRDLLAIDSDHRAAQDALTRLLKPE